MGAGAQSEQNDKSAELIQSVLENHFRELLETKDDLTPPQRAFLNRYFAHLILAIHETDDSEGGQKVKIL